MKIIMGSIVSLVTQMVDLFLRGQMTYVFGGIVSIITGGLDHVTKSERMKDMLILMKMYLVHKEEFGEEGVQMNLLMMSKIWICVHQISRYACHQFLQYFILYQLFNSFSSYQIEEIQSNLIS